MQYKCKKSFLARVLCISIGTTTLILKQLTAKTKQIPSACIVTPTIICDEQHIHIQFVFYLSSLFHCFLLLQSLITLKAGLFVMNYIISNKNKAIRCRDHKKPNLLVL